MEHLFSLRLRYHLKSNMFKHVNKLILLNWEDDPRSDNKENLPLRKFNKRFPTIEILKHCDILDTWILSMPTLYVILYTIIWKGIAMGTTGQNE